MTYHDDTHAHHPEPAGSQVNVNAGAGTPVVRESPMGPIRRVVNLIFGVIIALIGLRILLLVLGANEGNALVDGIYAITEIFVAPFRGVFSIDEVRPTGQSVLDIAALVAIVGWALIALLVNAILRIPDRSYA
ncbi:MAG TPA: YggT family protein [candidate division Zixibacteria bacterium]|nr:YggT family protein [candidate division Zixibacteria bacterium]